MSTTGNYTWQNFNNLGFISYKFGEEILQPIKDEVNEIQSDFTAHQDRSFAANLAGNIEKEYVLTKSKAHLDKIVLPFAAEYDKQFNYLQRFKLFKHNPPLTLEAGWVNFQRKHEFNPLHSHSGLFSFVIFLRIPYRREDEKRMSPGRNSPSNLAGCFSFYFINSLGDIQPWTVECDASMENTMLFFPAELNHEVYPFYTSDEYRITVSGNLVFDR